MNKLHRFRKNSLILGSLGFITSLFICGYALGMFDMEQSKIVEKSTNGLKFSGSSYGSYDTPYDAFLRFGLIAILFLVSVLIIRFTDSFLLKLLNILLLAVICFQGCIVLREPVDAIYFKLYEDNLPLLIRIIAVLFCFAGLIVLPAISIIILQLLSIWKAKTTKDLSGLG